MGGEVLRPYGTTSTTHGYGPHGAVWSTNDGAQERREPLVTPTLLGHLPHDNALILIGRCPPLLVTKAWYWQYAPWRGRVQGPDGPEGAA
jgi:type IV secretory pathway TraG/TraD family ATPase VirD4